MSDREDIQLIECYLDRGDEQSLEALVARHLPDIFAYVKRFTGNEDSAADIAQETFVKAWKSLRHYNPAMSFRGWLFTIAKRTAIDELRKKQAVPFSLVSAARGSDVAQNIVDEEPPLFEQLANASDRRAIDAALERLPGVSARIVRMKMSDDMTFATIARTLRMPLNTTKSMYRRALASLRTSLEVHQN